MWLVLLTALGFDTNTLYIIKKTFMYKQFQKCMSDMYTRTFWSYWILWAERHSCIWSNAFIYIYTVLCTLISFRLVSVTLSLTCVHIQFRILFYLVWELCKSYWFLNDWVDWVYTFWVLLFKFIIHVYVRLYLLIFW